MRFWWYFCEVRWYLDDIFVRLDEILNLVSFQYWRRHNALSWQLTGRHQTWMRYFYTSYIISNTHWTLLQKCHRSLLQSYLVTWLQLYKNSTWWHDWRKRQWFNGVTVRQWKRVRNLRLTLIVLILIMVAVCNTGCWWCWLCWHWWWLECWSFWWWCR